MSSSPSLVFRSLLALVLFVGFYILGISVAGGLLWIAYEAVMLQSNVLTIKLVWACVAGAAIVLWSLRPRVDKFEAPGPRITEAEQPELFTVIKDVSRAAGQPEPEDVYIIGGVNAWVANRGGMFGIGGHRVMTLGLALLQELNVSELKAVLAHEFGHFSGGDTQLGHLVYRTHGAIARTLAETRGRTVELLFRGYAMIFLRTSMAVSRSQEFAADAFAARIAGARALISGLEKTDRAGLLFLFYEHTMYRPIVSAGFDPPLAEGFKRYLGHPSTRALTAELLGQGQGQAQRGPYDSHPPTPQRVGALVEIAGVSELVDTRPAISLVRNLREIERGVLRTLGVESGTLQSIDWAEVPSRIFVPAWRQTIAKDIKALEGIAIDQLPSTDDETVAAGRRIGTPQAKLMDADDMKQQMVRSISAAVAVRLFDAGWPIIDEPGEVRFKRDDVIIAPFSDVADALNGKPGAQDAWRELCRKAHLTGSLSNF